MNVMVISWNARHTAIRLVSLGAGLFGAVLLAGCGSVSHGQRADPLLMIAKPDQVIVQTGTVAGLGVVLTDAQGHTLYMFPPDAGSRVTCTGVCVGTWPPLLVRDGGKPVGRGALNAADLGTLADPDTGGEVVTYGGYPLYLYAGDLAAGTANGQNLFSDGGPWYALNPDMQPVTTNPTGA